MFKCSICGKEFDNISDYANDVAKCATKVKHAEEEARQKKLRDEKDARIAEIRAAEERYYDLRKKYQRDYSETLYSARSPLDIFFNL